jgi:hypothetical protein
MSPIETSRINEIESCKNILFAEIVRRVAQLNNVPMMAATWNSVLEEIEYEVESLLIRPMPLNGMPSPEIEGMVRMWRKLEDESRLLRTANDWQVVLPMAV